MDAFCFFVVLGMLAIAGPLAPVLIYCYKFPIIPALLCALVFYTFFKTDKIICAFLVFLWFLWFGYMAYDTIIVEPNKFPGVGLSATVFHVYGLGMLLSVISILVWCFLRK